MRSECDHPAHRLASRLERTIRIIEHFCDFFGWWRLAPGRPINARFHAWMVSAEITQQLRFLAFGRYIVALRGPSPSPGRGSVDSKPLSGGHPLSAPTGTACSTTSGKSGN